MSEPSRNIRIDDRLIGDGQPCLIIAEVAQAHDGSLGMAHAYIDAVAKTGADAIKFQTHMAHAESTLDEPWRVKFSPQDKTRYDYWRRMEFTEDQWLGLAKHAAEVGLIFLSSPFSVDAVELLKRIGIGAWKIASGQISDEPVIESMADSGLPMLISIGMSEWSEIDSIVDYCCKGNLEFALFQTTSAYPCPPELVGLNIITELKERYGRPVGLSDHSGRVYASLASVVLGANILEVHVTFSKEMFGPDVSSSLTLGELSTVVEGIHYIETMLNNPVDKDSVAKKMKSMRRTFMKSVAAVRDLPKGTILQKDHLTLKKPGFGIPFSEIDLLVGRRLSKDVKADRLLNEADVESAHEKA
jgi:N-acetylneuraminate synthase